MKLSGPTPPETYQRPAQAALVSSLPFAVALLLASGCDRPDGPPISSDASVFEQSIDPQGMAEDAARLHQPSNAKRLDALVALLKEQNLEFTLQLVPNPKRDMDEREYGTNIVLSYGDAPKTIVLGSHFDAARLDDGSLSAGMIDNAASVAVMLRIAQNVRKLSLRHRIDIIFFDLEEIGLVGSQHFASSLSAENVAAMINLDVISAGTSLIFNAAGSDRSMIVQRALLWECAERLLACTAFPKYPSSDDRSFANIGVPTLSLAVVPDIDAHQLWLLLNGADRSGLIEGFVPDTLRSIHSPEDQTSRLNEESMQTAYRVVLALLTRLDRELWSAPESSVKRDDPTDSE